MDFSDEQPANALTLRIETQPPASNGTFARFVESRKQYSSIVLIKLGTQNDFIDNNDDSQPERRPDTEDQRLGLSRTEDASESLLPRRETISMWFRLGGGIRAMS
jgi:hypothetical protein